jgi:hypothetical protein
MGTVIAVLLMAGGRVLEIWECALLRGPRRPDGIHVLDNAARFIQAAGQALLESMRYSPDLADSMIIA